VVRGNRRDQRLLAPRGVTEHLGEQLALGREVPVQRSRGHAGPARDRAHRGLPVPAVRDDRARRVEDASPRLTVALVGEMGGVTCHPAESEPRFTFRRKAV
jgi:hypothetical protein